MHESIAEREKGQSAMKIRIEKANLPKTVNGVVGEYLTADKKDTEYLIAVRSDLYGDERKQTERHEIAHILQMYYGDIEVPVKTLEQEAKRNAEQWQETGTLDLIYRLFPKCDTVYLYGFEYQRNTENKPLERIRELPKAYR